MRYALRRVRSLASAIEAAGKVLEGHNDGLELENVRAAQVAATRARWGIRHG